jgi:hypothetical protein
VALNAGDVPGIKPKDPSEVGPAEDPETSADHDGWTIAAKHAGQLEDTTAVGASATAAPAAVGRIHSPEPGVSALSVHASSGPCRRSLIQEGARFSWGMQSAFRSNRPSLECYLVVYLVVLSTMLRS